VEDIAEVKARLDSVAALLEQQSGNGVVGLTTTTSTSSGSRPTAASAPADVSPPASPAAKKPLAWAKGSLALIAAPPGAATPSTTITTATAATQTLPDEGEATTGAPAAAATTAAAMVVRPDGHVVRVQGRNGDATSESGSDSDRRLLRDELRRRWGLARNQVA
jgi:hypothetical protein